MTGRLTGAQQPHACLWCGSTFPPRRTGGKRQRFCLPTHRRAFETAARQLGGRLITTGDVSATALHGPPATRALLPMASAGEAASGVAKMAQPCSVSPVRVFWATPSQSQQCDGRQYRGLET